MKVAIIKYNAGNVYSVLCAMRRLGVDASITADPDEIVAADRVIFPGVGEARAAMTHLQATGLDRLIVGLRQPVLGICIGMQLMCRGSEEGALPGQELTPCLGIFDVPVRRFDVAEPLKVPHMGWNTIDPTPGGGGDMLLRGVPAGSYVYYVHSYHAPVCASTIATTDYGGPYSAALHRDNFWAVQFHPEKSGRVGEQILSNFLALG